MIDIAKMTSLPLILSIFGWFIISSCSKSEDLSGYYFPFDNLKNGLIYQYSSVNHPELEDEFWYYSSTVDSGHKILKGVLYNSFGLPTQRVLEKEVRLGILQDSLILYRQHDSLSKVIVISPGPASVFPYYRNPNDSLIYKVGWTDPSDSLEYTLIRTKVFEADTVWSFQDKNFAAVIFSLEESLETFRSDIGMTNSAWSGREIYARGLGLVYYQKDIGPEFTKSYRLEDRYDLEQFQKSITKF